MAPDPAALQAVKQVERLDPSLNTYIRVMPEQAREAARRAEQEISAGEWRGPLHGVPLGIKDLLDVAGVPTPMGSPILRDNAPAVDATAVTRLREAGAVILGK